MLNILTDSCALMYGEFTLASGKSSHYYFDSKLLTLDHSAAPLIGDYFARKLSPDVQAIGGMALGAIPLVSILTLTAHKPGFYVRKEPKTHGTKNLIEGNFPDNPNAPIAIVDDVVTGGGSILQAINAVKQYPNPIIEVMCILDRNEGGRELLKSHGYELKSMFAVRDGAISFNA